MNRHWNPFLVLLLAMAAWPSPSPAIPSDRDNDGVVTTITGNTLELCFRRGSPPAIGDTVTIVREWIPFSKGTPAAPRYSTVGHARVTGGAQAPCVTADTLDGRPKRYDRARPASEAVGEPRA